MYSHIMVPVDLAHKGAVEKALGTAGALAALWSAKVTYVAVTSSLPGKLGHTPEEFAEKLAAFAAEQASTYGITTDSITAISHDPTTELDEALIKATGDSGADLVVMQTHHHRVTDWIWPSNGGKLATQADCSVMLVRD